MIGPLVLLFAAGLAGWLSSGWAGAVGAIMAAAALVGAVAAGSAMWARSIGRHLDPDEALEVAPRPPGFGRLCDAVYRRVLTGPGGEDRPRSSGQIKP